MVKLSIIWTVWFWLAFFHSGNILVPPKLPSTVFLFIATLECLFKVSGQNFTRETVISSQFSGHGPFSHAFESGFMSNFFPDILWQVPGFFIRFFLKLFHFHSLHVLCLFPYLRIL